MCVACPRRSGRAVGGAPLGGSRVFAENWPQWRGPGGQGVSAEQKKPPTEWAPDKNIAWKTESPGSGYFVAYLCGPI